MRLIHGDCVGYNGGGKPEWNSWHNMIQRCHDPKAVNTVCDRWRSSYANFLADMGRKPKGFTLDRWPDKNGNYEPGNCRWASPKEQANNRRDSREINTHCRRGHPHTPENTYTYPNGHQCCRVCKLLRTTESNERIRMNKLLQQLHKEEAAQTMVEYGLLIVVLALGAIAGIGSLAKSINAVFTQVAGQLT